LLDQSDSFIAKNLKDLFNIDSVGNTETADTGECRGHNGAIYNDFALRLNFKIGEFASYRRFATLVKIKEVVIP